MTIDWPRIQNLSLNEPKSMLERLAKLSEECGELAQELLIAANASGFQHKQKGEDGIAGEATDVLIVALSIFFKNGGSVEDLKHMLKKKCLKWEKGQRKH
jgi:NTP pyrophosphatase (non-canonical NTP hydrolase)